MTQKRVTIKDVAELAKVSPAVVSRVFNEDKSLSIKEETRQEVWEAIKKLNYSPNSVARGLRTNASKTIGILISDITNPFYTEIVKGVQTAAFEHGYTVLLCDTSDNREEERKYIDTLAAQQVEGIIVGSTFVEDEITEMLDMTGIKYVMINRVDNRSKAPYVKNRDIEGMTEMVNYLVSMGHKRIGFLSGPLYADTAIRRLTGFRKALLDNGIEYDSDYTLETMFDEESGYVACKKMLMKDPIPTVICAANDVSAIGAMRAIREAGLRIPDDISITGFNDIWVSARLTPALTTIHCDMFEMGKKAFELLIDYINNVSESVKAVLMDTKLIVRDSVKKI